MSERILRALMQLFAIIAKVDEVDESGDSPTLQSTKGKQIIEGLLKSELSSSDVNKYLGIFDQFLNETRGRLYSKNSDKKRTSLQSVKVLRICTQINKELTQRQKVVVLVRIIEFISSDHQQTAKELDFIQTVAEAFNIERDEFFDLYGFVESNVEQLQNASNHFYYCSKERDSLKGAKFNLIEGLDAPIHIVKVESISALFFKYYGGQELYINGQVVASDKTHLFNIGSTIRTAKSPQIYYSDLLALFMDFDKGQNLHFEAVDVQHDFTRGENAIEKMSFSTNSGQMIGIMGGSGTGKTTLMNIFNGKVKPKSGKVTINGFDLHSDTGILDGVIGNVGQSDLLIEELSVFQNLYFAAKLSLGGMPKDKLTKRIVDLLKTLGLYEIRDLRVGSPLQRVISGGQRKRLNIALELVREPRILFVDEPTSGLSSRDSENIVDLLKELANRGTLVFVVIHQPSSNIFKLFDRMLIMDDGGFVIYDGIPMNALVHFKTYSYKGNAHERECSQCGNVNSEQIFNIIDAKIVDEYGTESTIRKKSPEDWHKLYQENKLIPNITKEKEEPEVNTKRPSWLVQFTQYTVRDFLSKVSNKQYLIINGMVAPLLAFVLSFFIKYFNSGDGLIQYTYYSNENIPQFIFISVIVAIFLGLIIAGEEIHRDKRNLERERFLNLSKSSYLLAKVSIVFTISAIQAALFVSIANSILEIRGMWLDYWIIFFSTAALANMIGLNISSGFNSAKVIYIIVPLLIIPQLLFSGVIVKFDKLHPSLSNATQVPLVGNVMASRWAYEALAVEQASRNQEINYYFDHKVEGSKAEWKRDFWAPEMKRQLKNLKEFKNQKSEEALELRDLLINEFQKEDTLWSDLNCLACIASLKSDNIDHVSINEMTYFLDILKLKYGLIATENNTKIEHIIDSIGVEKYKTLQQIYANESLNDLVTNKREEHKIIVGEDALYQNDDPIFNKAEGSFLSAHFYAPTKRLFGKEIDTYWANLIILWIQTVILYIILYYDLLRRFILFSRRFRFSRN